MEVSPRELGIAALTGLAIAVTPAKPRWLFGLTFGLATLFVRAVTKESDAAALYGPVSRRSLR
jgi:hypothetical protein